MVSSNGCEGQFFEISVPVPKQALGAQSITSKMVHSSGKFYILTQVNVACLFMVDSSTWNWWCKGGCTDCCHAGLNLSQELYSLYKMYSIQILNAVEGNSKNYFPKVTLRLYTISWERSRNQRAFNICFIYRFCFEREIVKTNDWLKSCQSVYNMKCMHFCCPFKKQDVYP